MPESLQRWIYDPTVGKLVAVAVAFLLIAVLVRLGKRAAGQLIHDGDARYRVRKMVGFLGYLAAALVVGLVFSDKFGAFTVAFGVAGAGIAFALQEVIASVAGWVAIAMGNFFRVGDRVQLGGIRGDVIDVGVLRTTLMECGSWVAGDLYNGRIVRVANSFVFKEPVFNYSADFPFLWDEITVPVRYGSDHKLARTLVEEVVTDVVGEYTAYAKEAWAGMVTKYRIEDARVEPMITMVANDNWIEFTARYVVDFKRRRGTKDLIFTALLDAVEATDGRVRLASATFEVTDAPVLGVRLIGPDGAVG
jgi:small-conductance mechanosensitive channel